MSDTITITKAEAAEAAEAIHILCDIDEGEHVDVEALRALASKLYMKTLSSTR